MNGPKFDVLTGKLKRLDPHIRASYRKFLELNQDVLAWTMAVDGLFLFDFLCRNGIKKDFLKSSEHLKFLADSTGRKLAEDAIMRDPMMLENQIPIFKEGECRVEIPDDIFIEEDKEVKFPHESDLNERDFYERADRALEIVGSIPLTGHIMKPHVELIRGLMKLPISDVTSSVSAAWAKAPVTSQNLIPTATSLSKAGIKFCKTDNIKSIQFDKETAMFFLPMIELGVNSEVIIRNLIAYEAMANMSSLKFAQYIELMDGIIDTEDDVKILALLGAVILLLLMALQTVCSAYSCPRLFMSSGSS
ncbi:hypothetical protein CRG98_005815 [Punica granatum]|uniref:Uncharacterized protein n=1 Tax=Punica granatum TaxID=22663 RepID=A0A2I0KZE1_PUNGR|nr:hypothetical protein CRG98_005815 [Punica granatum]